MKLRHYLLIFTPIILRIINMALFKEASMSMTSFSVLNILTNGLYLVCIVIFFLIALSWQQALRIFPLSVAYSFQSFIYIGLLIVGHLFFNEVITLYNVVGSIIIILGVVVVSTSATQ